MQRKQFTARRRLGLNSFKRTLLGLPLMEIRHLLVGIDVLWLIAENKAFFSGMGFSSPRCFLPLPLFSCLGLHKTPKCSLCKSCALYCPCSVSGLCAVQGPQVWGDAPLGFPLCITAKLGITPLPLPGSPRLIHCATGSHKQSLCSTHTVLLA